MDAHSSTPLAPTDSLMEPRRVSRPQSSSSRDSEGTRFRKDFLKLWEDSITTRDGFRVGAFAVEEATVSDEVTVISNPPDANLVDWEGDNDRANPLNWPKCKKAFNIIVILFMCVTHAFAATAFIPSIEHIAEKFESHDLYLSAFIVCAYVLGSAVGPLLIVPVSEIFGRVPMYHFCNLLFIGSTCWCAVTKNLVTLAVARLLAGCGGCVTQVLAAGSIRDMFRGKMNRLLVTAVEIALCLTPAISPLAGSHINAKLGWSWVFWITAMMGGFCIIPGFALFETYEPVLLWRKANKRRQLTHNPALYTRFEANPSHTITSRCWKATCRPLRMLISPSFVVPSLLPAVGFAFLYIIYITLPQAFLSIYTWPLKNSGLAYLGIAVGFLIVLGGGHAASDGYVKMRARNNDTRAENRLIPLLCFWPLTGLGLFLYGCSLHNKWHWTSAVCSLGLLGAGVMSVILFNNLYVIDAFPASYESATHANVLLQSLLGGVVPIFSYKLYEYMKAPYAFYCLGGIVLGLSAISGLFYFLRREDSRVSQGESSNEGDV